MSNVTANIIDNGKLQSPHYAQTSLAAGLTLGFERGLFYRNATLKGLNLLVTYDNKCAADCSYCGLARSRNISESKTFIRVSWPTYAVDEIIDAVNGKQHNLQRVCVGMITHKKAVEDSISIINRFREETDLLISTLVSPTVMEKGDLGRIKEAGADMCGIAVDAATNELFDKLRGEKVSGPHRWRRFWDAVAESVTVFGRYKAGVHLVVGLGETEKEMVNTIQRAHDLGATTHLFSFFPEAGSKMENWPQPDLGHYRRIQLARYIINNHLGQADNMQFSKDGQLTDFGQNLERFLEDGEAFMTSGCAGKDGKVACNRPYGNERPSRPIRNFPFMPTSKDLILIRKQLWRGVK
ncbi:radical SAM protein [Metallumcola ferriviriculae]|uniref:Radical SAM protein n=1 Tax=Metallumcola ferriviriculae TaxID=3039180 RepID=A0AAU0URS9_9FIRM|nr:radical SAM protein [Desulfitibacteraceae bacterium MK1]